MWASVTDVTSLPQRILWERGCKVYYNAYAGNESPNCCNGRHVRLYRAIATGTGGLWRRDRRHYRPSEECTIDEPDFIASYQGISVLLFLEQRTVFQWPTWSSSSRHSHSYRRATMTGQTTLEQRKTVLLMGWILITGYRSKALI